MEAFFSMTKISKRIEKTGKIASYFLKGERENTEKY